MNEHLRKAVVRSKNRAGKGISVTVKFNHRTVNKAFFSSLDLQLNIRFPQRRFHARPQVQFRCRKIKRSGNRQLTAESVYAEPCTVHEQKIGVARAVLFLHSHPIAFLRTIQCRYKEVHRGGRLQAFRFRGKQALRKQICVQPLFQFGRHSLLQSQNGGLQVVNRRKSVRRQSEQLAETVYSQIGQFSYLHLTFLPSFRSCRSLSQPN